MKSREPVAPLGGNAFRWASCLGCLVLLTAETTAQPVPVENDDIARRLPLALNQPRHSRTDGCTVQRACVDERLTGKCIQYHNDQWFSFTPPTDGRYYVNIGQQQCRDVRGVQLVVTQGTPCEPETYQILTCTSLGNQDDVFVPLDNLRAGQEYLLDVDGYLEDYCRFAIEVSTTARGLPQNVRGTSLSRLSGRLVQLDWSLPDSLPAEKFEVWRRDAGGFRSEVVRTVAVRRDAYGRRQPDYTITDTLPAAELPTRYEYKIVARSAVTPVLVGEQTVVWPRTGLSAGNPAALSVDTRPEPAAGRPNPGNFVVLPLQQFPVKARLTVLVLDAASGRLLKRAQLIRQKNYAEQSKLPTYRFQQQGISNLLVLIRYEAKSGTSTTEVKYTL